MTYTREQKRARAAAALRLLEDADLADLLTEIERDATASLLASGGNPERLSAAWALALVPQTLRTRLQARIDAQTRADKDEQKRG